MRTEDSVVLILELPLGLDIGTGAGLGPGIVKGILVDSGLCTVSSRLLGAQL